MSEAKVKEETELTPVETTNKYDLTQLKNAVDDEISRYYNKEQNYIQSHIHTDFKLFLGFVSCAIAGGSFFYEYKTNFNQAFQVTTVCVIVYWILQAIGFVYSFLIEKNELFIGTQKSNGKTAALLKISTKIEKYSPEYQFEFEYVDKASGKKAQYKVVRNITTWFNSNGVLVREVMDKDLEKYLLAVKEKLHKD